MFYTSSLSSSAVQSFNTISCRGPIVNADGCQWLKYIEMICDDVTRSGPIERLISEKSTQEEKLGNRERRGPESHIERLINEKSTQYIRGKRGRENGRGSYWTFDQWEIDRIYKRKEIQREVMVGGPTERLVSDKSAQDKKLGKHYGRETYWTLHQWELRNNCRKARIMFSFIPSSSSMKTSKLA